MKTSREEGFVTFTAGGAELAGNLVIPSGSKSLVIFAHGSGSSRLSPRNRFVAEKLQESGLGTFLFDLLTPAEETEDRITAAKRFDIELLAQRLAGATKWVKSVVDSSINLGYFGASTGAAAALVASVGEPERVKAIVSRGGRPDMADGLLEKVKAPTLLIVGGNDHQVIELNRSALSRLTPVAKLEIVPGATHLFEEPGALEEVARLAGSWFSKYLV